MKRFHWLLLGFAASVCIAAVAPTGGGGSSGVPTLNGTATNLQVYSSGTTNWPLRVAGTNTTRTAYIDKDGYLNLLRGDGHISYGFFGANTLGGGGRGMMLGAAAGGGPGADFWIYGDGGVGIQAINYQTMCFLIGATFKFRNDTLFGWSSGSPESTSLDTALYRNAAGIIEVNNGTAGQYRDLVTRSTFATNASITNITADSYVTTQQTLSYASATNLTVDANKSLHFVSLTNTAYFAQPSNLGVGRTFTVILQQDGTGTRAVTFNTNYWKFPGGVVPTITTNANAYDVLSCISCPYGTNVFAIHNAKFQ